MARSTKGQSQHDREVRRIAKDYQQKGYDVEADIRGWKQPSTIEGVRPDVIARKGSHETAVEVETRESVGSKRDEKQKEAFKDWSKGDPTKHFKRIMTDE